MFQQAYELLGSKTSEEMTDEEHQLVAIATTFVAHELPKAYPGVLTINEGLLLLAKITEEAQ